MSAHLHASLSRRESQIVEAVQELGEASVTGIRERLPDAPGASAVRVMVGALVRRGVLARRRDGRRNLYRLAEGQEAARRRGLAHLRRTLFGGSAADVVAALLDEGDVSADELDRLAALVDRARSEAAAETDAPPLEDDA
jgi:predicted transcriptional regulator